MSIIQAYWKLNAERTTISRRLPSNQCELLRRGFLEHLGELLAKEYSQLMEQASLEVESIEKLEI